MTDLKPLLRRFGLDAIYGIDVETYYADGYSLSDKKRGTTDYIIDPRFELQLVSVRKDSWTKPRVMLPKDFKSFAATVNWSRAGFLAHHAHFDGLICTRAVDLNPKMYFDTLSMARAILPVQVGGSLDRVAKALGHSGKTKSEALVAVKGRRLKEFSKAELKNLQAYAGDDIDETWLIFQDMLPYFPDDELRLIDMTVRMYARPKIKLDEAALRKVLENEIARKRGLVLGLGLGTDYDKVKKQLNSKPQFAALLEKAGVKPPKKVSVKRSATASEEAGYEVVIEDFAMSKQDQEFKDLLAHPKKKVRNLVAARFAISSGGMESRCNLLLGRSNLEYQPVYLLYAGAKTLRWSGGDNANWQNLSSKRKEGGAELRASIYAPPGFKFIIADLAQIEARISAWFAGQRNIVEVFRAFDTIVGWTTDEKGKPKPIRAGPDVYRYTAANSIYNKHIDLITDDERFLGKTCVLALGFQAGWKRFAGAVRIGNFGPPMDITDSLARDIHTAWRRGHPHIVADWKATQTKVAQAFLGHMKVDHGVVSYEGTPGKVGWMHLPGGMGIRYDDVRHDEEGALSYISKYRFNKVKPPTIERTRLYGGIEVENRTQALARRVIAEHMLAIKDELKDRCDIVMSTHDEIVGLVPNRSAKRALSVFTEIMSTPPAWAKDLPIAVDAHISERYDK